MKTFIRGVLTTVLIFTFTLIPTVMYAEKMVNEDLIGYYFKEEMTTQLTTALTDNITGLSEEEYNIIKNTIENDKEINEFIDKYSNRIIEDLSKEEIEDISLEEDIRNIFLKNKELIEESIGEKLTDEQLKQAIEEVLPQKNEDNTYQQFIKEARKEMPANAQAMVDSYNTITSNEFIIIAAVISIVATMIIALLKKPYYKWIVNVAIAGIIASLFITLIGGSLSLLANLVIEATETTLKISATPMLVTAGIMLVISISLVVINNILDKNKNKNHAIS